MFCFPSSSFFLFVRVNVACFFSRRCCTFFIVVSGRPFNVVEGDGEKICKNFLVLVPSSSTEPKLLNFDSEERGKKKKKEIAPLLFDPMKRYKHVSRNRWSIRLCLIRCRRGGGRRKERKKERRSTKSRKIPWTGLIGVPSRETPLRIV